MLNQITHYGSLVAKGALSNKFFEQVRWFKHNLGSVFIQFSDKFPPTHRKELFAFLETLPTDLQFFLEVRHPGWFTDQIVVKELFNFLKDHISEW